MQNIEKIIQIWKQQLEADPALSADLSGPYSLIVTNHTEAGWSFKQNSGRLILTEGKSRLAPCLRLNADTLFKVAAAKVSPQQAFVDGSIEATGEVEGLLELSLLLSRLIDRSAAIISES